LYNLKNNKRKFNEHLPQYFKIIDYLRNNKLCRNKKSIIVEQILSRVKIDYI